MLPTYTPLFFPAAAAPVAGDAATGGTTPPATANGVTPGNGAAAVDLKPLLDQMSALTAEIKGVKDNQAKDAEYIGAVGKMFKADLPAAEREAATRVVLSRQGYSKEAIDSYVAAQAPETGEGGPGNQTDPTVQRIDRMEGDFKATRLRQMESALQGEIGKALDGNERVKVYFERVKESATAAKADPVKAVQEARQNLVQQVRRQTIDQLATLRNGGAQVDETMFAVEVQKATGPVLAPLSVIGGPNQVGRTPETVTGDDSLLKKPPVEFPKYDPAKGTGDLEKQAMAATEDALNRMVLSTPTSDKTAV